MSFLILIIVFLLMSNIFYPAYVSYSSACLNKDIEGYITTGKTTYTPESEEIEKEMGKNITIEIFSLDKKIVKHELVHVNQIKNNRAYSCYKLKGFGRYFNEVEAYSMSYTPDFIFRIFYPLYGEYEKLV